MRVDHNTFITCLYQTGYSVVSACVVALRWNDKPSSQTSNRLISQRGEGLIFLLAIALSGFVAGVLFRYSFSFIFMIVAAVVAILSAVALYLRQVSNKFDFTCLV